MGRCPNILAKQYGASRQTVLKIAGDRYRPRPRALLTAPQVTEMRTARASGATLAELAAQYGVSVPCACNICRGKTYRNVGGPIS